MTPEDNTNYEIPMLHVIAAPFLLKTLRSLASAHIAVPGLELAKMSESTYEVGTLMKCKTHFLETPLAKSLCPLGEVFHLMRRERV